MADGFHRQTVIKVDIRHQGNGNALLDLRQSLCRLHIWHRAADDFTPCRRQALNLVNGGLYILCPRIRHRLD